MDDAPRTGVAPEVGTAGIVGIARGGSLNLAGAAFNQVLRFGIVLLLARFLGEYQTGLYFQAFAILSLLGILASFGFTRRQSLTRFVALYRADEDGAAVRGVVRLALLTAAGIATLMGAALFAGSSYVATEIFHDAQLALLLRFVAVALPSTVYTDCALAATQGFKMMRPYARINLSREAGAERPSHRGSIGRWPRSGRRRRGADDHECDRVHLGGDRPPQACQKV